MSTINYEELPTPSNHKDLLVLRDEVFNQRMEWIKPPTTDKWKHLKTKKGFVLEELKLDTCKFPVLKGTGILQNVDINYLEHLAFDATLKEKQKITEDLLEHKIVTQVDNDTIVYKDTFDVPIGFDKREFLILRCKHRLDNGGVLVTIQSINCEDEDCAKKCVRGTSNCAIYLEPVGDKEVKLINVNHINPKGSVSSMMVKLFKKRSLDTLFHIQNVCQNR